MQFTHFSVKEFLSLATSSQVVSNCVISCEAVELEHRGRDITS